MVRCKLECICAPFRKTKPKELRLLVIGMDASGKTTFINKLARISSTDDYARMPRDAQSVEDVENVESGSIEGDGQLFNSTTMRKGSLRIFLYEPKTSFSKQFYSLVHGYIFMIDSRFIKQSKKLKTIITIMTSDPRLAGKPLLIMFNKQDHIDSSTKNQWIKALQIRYKQRRKAIHYDSCSAIKDEKIFSKVDWMINYIMRHHNEIERLISSGISFQNTVDYDNNVEIIRQTYATRPIKVQYDHEKETDYVKSDVWVGTDIFDHFKKYLLEIDKGLRSKPERIEDEFLFVFEGQKARHDISTIAIKGDSNDSILPWISSLNTSNVNTNSVSRQQGSSEAFFQTSSELSLYDSDSNVSSTESLIYRDKWTEKAKTQKKWRIKEKRLAQEELERQKYGFGIDEMPSGEIAEEKLGRKQVEGDNTLKAQSSKALQEQKSNEDEAGDTLKDDMPLSQQAKSAPGASEGHKRSIMMRNLLTSKKESIKKGDKKGKKKGKKKGGIGLPVKIEIGKSQRSNLIQGSAVGEAASQGFTEGNEDD